MGQYEASRIGGRRVVSQGESGRARRVGISRRGLVRIALGTVIGVFAVLLLAQVLIQFVIRPRMSLRRIVLQGDLVVTERQVAETGGIGPQASYFSVRPDRVRAALEGLPAVRRATVRKQPPDTLIVEIEARKPLAAALVPVEETTVPILIDAEGLIFAAGTEAAGRDLPVISGIGFARWDPGTRLPPVLRPLLEDLRRLQTDEPALFAFISEIEVTRSGERDVELLIYPSGYTTPIRSGGRISPDLLKNAALLLDVLRRERMEDRVQEVDLRAREVVYRERGVE